MPLRYGNAGMCGSIPRSSASGCRAPSDSRTSFTRCCGTSAITRIFPSAIALSNCLSREFGTALPTMLARNYSTELSVGTIASAGTLGILIPPSIMLVIMGDLMTVSVGTLFTAAILPGLALSVIYLAYIGTIAFVNPRVAPPLAEESGPQSAAEFWRMIFRSFLPPSPPATSRRRR